MHALGWSASISSRNAMKRSAIEKIIVGKTKLKRFLRHSSKKPRKFGADLIKCSVCGTKIAVIKKYGLNVCRRCFREVAKELGFRKLS